jgi:hypothetical protein
MPLNSTRGAASARGFGFTAADNNRFIVATGGTILTCGDFKTHVFTGPGSFEVTNAGKPTGSNSVEYLVVAGGGAGGARHAGGGGAGGYRQNYPSPTTAGLPVTAQIYPITVGGGGSPTTVDTVKNPGSNSIFSTITSTGGGGGTGNSIGDSGGSGGGSRNGFPAGLGNTPPVSPPQGNNAGAGPPVNYNGSGGGGAGAVGTSCKPGGGNGGVGSPIATTFFGPTSPSYGTTGPAPGRYFAGGGGGGSYQGLGSPGPIGSGGSGGGGSGGAYPTVAAAGTTNTGGGGGGGGSSCSAPGPLGCASGAGGSGIVVIRYKFQ